jgi:hypothetical protein
MTFSIVTTTAPLPMGLSYQESQVSRLRYFLMEIPGLRMFSSLNATMLRMGSSTSPKDSRIK